VTFDVLPQATETLLPHVGEGVTRPTVHLLESLFAISDKSAVSVLDTLFLDPGAELVAIDRVRPRHAGVTVAFDILLQTAETFLPPVGVRGPGSAGHVLESA